MHCIDPPALNAVELAMYLENEADAAVANHIAACPFCRANAVTLAQEEQGLTHLLYRSTCPTPEELRDHYGSLLNRVDSSNIALHVAHCPHCTRELFVLNEFMANAETTTTNLLQHLLLQVATLLHQPLPPTGTALPMGQRGGASTIQIYQADELQIGLETIHDSTTGQTRLQGVITGGELNNLLVHLWHDDQLVATTTVDPLLGDFHFANLPPSLTNDADTRFELIVSAPQVKVRIPAIQVHP